MWSDLKASNLMVNIIHSLVKKISLKRPPNRQLLVARLSDIPDIASNKETYLTFIIRVSVTSTGDREDGDNSKFIRVCLLICNKGRSIAAVMSRLHSLRCRYQLDNRDDMRSPANPSTCGFEFTVGKIRLVVQTILRTLHLFLS
jgi:hypothetical protein